MVADKVNSYLNQIADLNQLIKGELALDRSTAELEDQRDEVMRNISEIIAIDYYQTSTGEIVVQTARGNLLADSLPQDVNFNPQTIGPGSYYPLNTSGILLGDAVTGIDITSSALGGKLGALVELRDEILPTYAGQLD